MLIEQLATPTSTPAGMTSIKGDFATENQPQCFDHIVNDTCSPFHPADVFSVACEMTVCESAIGDDELLSIRFDEDVAKHHGLVGENDVSPIIRKTEFNPEFSRMCRKGELLK